MQNIQSGWSWSVSDNAHNSPTAWYVFVIFVAFNKFLGWLDNGHGTQEWWYNDITEGWPGQKQCFDKIKRIKTTLDYVF